MKLRATLFVFAVTIATSFAASVCAEPLAFSHEDGKIEFVGSKDDGRHDGGFKQFSGELEWAANAPQDCTLSVTIDTGSLWRRSGGIGGQKSMNVDAWVIGPEIGRPSGPLECKPPAASLAASPEGVTPRVTGGFTKGVDQPAPSSQRAPVSTTSTRSPRRQPCAWA